MNSKKYDTLYWRDYSFSALSPKTRLGQACYLETLYAHLYAGIGDTWIASDEGNANWEGRFGLGYGRELPWGLTAYAYAEGGYAAYDGPLDIFGQTRSDVRLRGQISLLKRNWSAFGFAPKLGYNFSQTRSNIGFFSYTRHQTDLSFTRVF